MRETKCDLCKKKIKDKPIIAGIGFLEGAELCDKCGRPILEFLRKNKLIEDKKSQK